MAAASTRFCVSSVKDAMTFSSVNRLRFASVIARVWVRLCLPLVDEGALVAALTLARCLFASGEVDQADLAHADRSIKLALMFSPRLDRLQSLVSWTRVSGHAGPVGTRTIWKTL